MTNETNETTAPAEIPTLQPVEPTEPPPSTEGIEVIEGEKPATFTVETHEQAAEINHHRTAEQGYVKVGDVVPQE